MNSTGKFLVSALLVHAANLKRLSDTQTNLPVPCPLPAGSTTASPLASAK